MKKALPIIFILLAHTAMAQSDTARVNVAQIDSGYTNKLAIRIAPLAFVDAFAGTAWRGGIEYRFWKMLAIIVDGGTFINFQKKDAYISKTDLKGFFIRSEIRAYGYPDETNRRIRQYAALEYLYKKTDFNFTDSINMRLPLPFQKPYEKTYRIFKEISAITLKSGAAINFTSRFFVDVYGGVGVRWVHGHNTLNPWERDRVLTGEFHGPMIGEAIRGYRGITLNLALGCQVCYRLL